MDNSHPVEALLQNTPVSCGQTSVAMAINHLTGKHLIDLDIDRKYGFGLLTALNSESGPNHSWEDAGNLTPSLWPGIQKRCELNLPVVIGLNGSLFSVTGRGHIVLITKVLGDTVTFADPAHGTFRRVSKKDMEAGKGYPGGDFVLWIHIPAPKS